MLRCAGIPLELRLLHGTLRELSATTSSSGGGGSGGSSNATSSGGSGGGRIQRAAFIPPTSTQSYQSRLERLLTGRRLSRLQRRRAVAELLTSVDLPHGSDIITSLRPFQPLLRELAQDEVANLLLSNANRQLLRCYSASVDEGYAPAPTFQQQMQQAEGGRTAFEDGNGSDQLEEDSTAAGGSLWYPAADEGLHERFRYAATTATDIYTALRAVKDAGEPTGGDTILWAQTYRRRLEYCALCGDPGEATSLLVAMHQSFLQRTDELNSAADGSSDADVGPLGLQEAVPVTRRDILNALATCGRPGSRHLVEALRILRTAPEYLDSSALPRFDQFRTSPQLITALVNATASMSQLQPLVQQIFDSFPENYPQDKSAMHCIVCMILAAARCPDVDGKSKLEVGVQLYRLALDRLNPTLHHNRTLLEAIGFLAGVTGHCDEAEAAYRMFQTKISRTSVPMFLTAATYASYSARGQHAVAVDALLDAVGQHCLPPASVVEYIMRQEAGQQLTSSYRLDGTLSSSATTTTTSPLAQRQTTFSAATGVDTPSMLYSILNQHGIPRTEGVYSTLLQHYASRLAAILGSSGGEGVDVSIARLNGQAKEEAALDQVNLVTAVLVRLRDYEPLKLLSPRCVAALLRLASLSTALVHSSTTSSAGEAISAFCKVMDDILAVTVDVRLATPEPKWYTTSAYQPQVVAAAAPSLYTRALGHVSSGAYTVVDLAGTELDSCDACSGEAASYWTTVETAAALEAAVQQGAVNPPGAAADQQPLFMTVKLFTALAAAEGPPYSLLRGYFGIGSTNTATVGGSGRFAGVLSPTAVPSQDPRAQRIGVTVVPQTGSEAATHRKSNANRRVANLFSALHEVEAARGGGAAARGVAESDGRVVSSALHAVTFAADRYEDLLAFDRRQSPRPTAAIGQPKATATVHV